MFQNTEANAVAQSQNNIIDQQIPIDIEHRIQASNTYIVLKFIYEKDTLLGLAERSYEKYNAQGLKVAGKKYWGVLPDHTEEVWKTRTQKLALYKNTIVEVLKQFDNLDSALIFLEKVKRENSHDIDHSDVSSTPSEIQKEVDKVAIGSPNSKANRKIFMIG